MRRFKLWFVISLSLVIMLMTFSNSFTLRNDLKAETTEIDDSPLGEKIVDIKIMGDGQSLLALTENGQVYEVPYVYATGTPVKVLNAENATDGEKYLSNIERIEAGGKGDVKYAINKNGDVFGWGNNLTPILPGIDPGTYDRPQKIELDFSLKDICFSKRDNFAMFLSKTGEIYAIGRQANGQGGVGTAGILNEITLVDVVEQDDGTLIPMPKIKYISTEGANSFLLAEDGTGYGAGYSRTGTGYPYNAFLTRFRQVRTKDNQFLTGITDIHEFQYGAVFETDNGFYFSESADGNHSTYMTPVSEFGDLLTDEVTKKAYPNHIFSDIGYGHITFISADRHIFVVTQQRIMLNPITLIPYVEGEITKDYTGAKKVLRGSMNRYTYVLSEDGAVYRNGKKLRFGDISFTGKKQDSSIYKSADRYNDAITIEVDALSKMEDIRYDIVDKVTGAVDQSGLQASKTIQVEKPVENTRYYKRYDFYTLAEPDIKYSFTVDLYNKAPTVQGVSNNGYNMANKVSATFGDNGISGNTISATIQRSNGSEIPYSSGTVFTEVGSYVLTLKDLYGNTNTYSFKVSDQPMASGIEFTKSPSGELIYANSITKAGNVIGSLTLTYPEGMSSSTIKTLDVGTDNDGSNFEVVNTNELKVKGTNLTAKEYIVPVSGTDQKDVPFSGEVTITIAKATQTMAWDETSAKLADNGIALGDEVTLGVKDTLGNVDVAYGLKTPNSCITMTGDKVKVTCIPNPASVTFTATPSGNDNYTSDPIELTVSISKKSISLKTVIQDSDSTFKDRVSVKVGDTTSTVKVVDLEGNEVSNLGIPELTFKKNGTVFADPTIESGTYTVEASYPSDSAADNYTITWTSKANLIVSDIVIDENNASDFYTLISDGKTYTPNTWTNQPIVITPVHKDFNIMSVENADTSSSSPYTYSVEGSKEVKLTFATADGAKASTKVTLNYDKTKPVLTSFQYDDVNSPVRAVLRSLFGFTHYFDQEKAVKFIGSDESTGSGVKEYTYEIVELNVDGSEITSSKKTGTLDSVNSVKLEMDKNYKITAKVIDNAGNPSEPMSETVQLNDEIGDLSLSAVSDGLPYDGSKWTSKAIDITLTGSNKSGVKKYQYSTDGNTFIDFTSNDGTITLPSPLISIDNRTYTFRAVNNDGTTNDKTLSMKVDTEKPIVKVKGMIGNTLYDGCEVDTDVTIIPYQESDSISDITYYYTSEASSKDTNPLTDTGWKKYTGVLSETRNGTHTYYVKGVNGAGVQSDPADITIKIAKKEYTKVNVEVTSEDQPYASGTWAKHDITFTLSGGLSDESIITGYEVTTTKDGNRPSATATWTRVNGDKKHVVTTNSEQETYWFRVLPVDPNGSISKGTLINLDVEKPEKPTFTMEEVNTNALARFVNAVSFGQWMKAGVKVSINSNDNISGLDHFSYEEVTNDGRVEKQSQNGILYYEEDVNIKLQAIAYDKAGNVSDVSEESGDILIDTIPPVIAGVKDQDVYKKYYYVYRTITYTDDGSGIDEASAIIKKDSVSSPLLQKYKVKDFGSYEVSVKDNAGNETVVRFQLVPLPDIDTKIDGTDESKDIIDQVKEELEEERNNLAPDEIKDYEKWIEDATKKWESERKKKLEDKETGTIIEGEGDTSFDPNTVLIVDEIDESKVPNLPRRAINVYDVYMKKGDTVIQPDGSVKVYLPYTEKETPIVYEIDENGNVKEIKGTVENGFVTFMTNTLKKYAISNEAQKENKKDVCVVGPDKDLDTKDDVCGSDESTKNPDGSVDVPDGGKVIFPDKEIDAPDGAHINSDGSVDFPDGSHYDPDGNLKPKDEENNTCTAGPDGKLGTSDDVCGEGNGSDDPKKNEDGSVDVPDGGTIHFPDKEIDVPDGAHINPDGSVELPDGTEYDKDGNKKPKVCDLHDGETLNVDTDKDGLPDINLDIDNDCVADLNIDIDDDRIPDLNIDSTGDTEGSPPDGKADINIDKNGDGFADINILKLSKWVPNKNVEINGFAYDTMSNLTPDINVDKDGDGVPDQNIDADGDGIPDKNLSKEWENNQNQNSDGALTNSTNTGDQTKWFVWWIIAFVTTITMVHQVYSYRKSKS